VEPTVLMNSNLDHKKKEGLHFLIVKVYQLFLHLSIFFSFHKKKYPSFKGKKQKITYQKDMPLPYSQGLKSIV
jgi:hypothetical protein